VSYIHESSGRAAAIVDAEDDLGALMGPAAIENARVQSSDKGRVGKLASNVGAGLARSPKTFRTSPPLLKRMLVTKA